MSAPKTIFVKSASVNGNGSYQFPFSSIQDAIDFATKNSVIYMMDAVYSFDGRVDIVDKEGLVIRPYSASQAFITNIDGLNIDGSTLTLSGIGLASKPSADYMMNATNSKVSITDMEISTLNFASPSSLSSAFYLFNSSVSVVNSKFDFTSISDPGVLSALFTVKNNSVLSMSGIRMQSIPKNLIAIAQYDENTKLSVVNSEIGPGAYDQGKVGMASFVTYFGRNSSFGNRLELVGNTFIGLPRVVKITNDPAISNQNCYSSFSSNLFGSDFDGVAILKNFFKTCRCSVQADINVRIYSYNNTINRGNFAFILKNGCSAEVRNTIITNLEEIPLEARPESSLQMAYPYQSSTFNVGNGASAMLAYSCIYNNFGIAVPGGVTKGAMLRYLDPIYVDEVIEDLRLSPNSPLVDSGYNIGAPYIGSSVDIGAYEGKRFSTDTEFTDYLKRKSNLDLTETMSSSVDFVSYAKDKLKELYPQLNLSPGSPIIDLLVKPFVLMADPLQKEIESLFTKMSVINFDQMPEVDFDRLAANYFVIRRYGGLASGTVRIYMYAPEEIFVPARTNFYTADGLIYESRVDYTYSAMEVVLNQEASSGYYYVDILVEAQQFGDVYNIPNESIGTSDLVHDFIAKISNPYPIVGGTDSETNEDLYNRIKRAVTVRNLINKPSIETVLKENFQFLDYVTAIGFRDPEMQRDVMYPFPGHFGGCADIYISTKHLVDSEVVLKIKSDNNGAFISLSSGSLQESPILWLKSLVVLDAITGVEISELAASEYEAVLLDKPARFSSKDSFQIRFSDPLLVNRYVKIKYKSCPLVSQLYDFVLNPKNRIVLGDYLVKHFYPVKVDVTIRCKNFSNQNIIRDAVSDHIFKIKNGGTLDKAAMLSQIASLSGFVADPVTVTMSMYSPDSLTPTVVQLADTQTVSNLSKFVPGTINILPLA